MELLSKESLSFVKAAENFCALIENCNTAEGKEFLIMLQNELIRLYECALLSSKQDLHSGDAGIDSSSFKINKTLLDTLIEKLDVNRYYWVVFDPTDINDKEPGLGDLLDDVVDIYQDLRSAITTFYSGVDGGQEYAVWQFKDMFIYHWNDHCIGGLYALHYFIKKASEL